MSFNVNRTQAQEGFWRGTLGGGQGACPGGAKVRVKLSEQYVLIVNVTSKTLVLKKDSLSRLDFDALNSC